MKSMLNIFLILLIIGFINSETLFLYTSLSPGHLSPPHDAFKYDPDHLEKKDFFKQEWDTQSELTIPGIRSSFLLGYYFSKIKYENNSVIPTSYNPNDIYVQSTLDNYTIQTASVFFQGIFRPLEGPTLFDNQTKLARANLNFTEEAEQEITDLKNDVLKSRVTIIPLHTVHKYDHFLDLYDYLPISGCHPNNKIINKNIDNNEVIKFQTESFINEYKSSILNFFLKEHNIALTEKEINNINFIENFCENLMSDVNDARDLSILKNYFDKDNLVKKCQEYLMEAVYKKKYFGDEENTLLILGTSEILRQILNYMDKSIKNDKKEINADSHPKFVVLSQRKIANIGLLLFFKRYFKKEFEINFESNTFINFEINKEGGNYIVSITYDEMEIYSNKNYEQFKTEILDIIWTQDMIYDYCDFDDVYKSNKSYQRKMLALIIVFGVLFFVFLGGTIFLLFKIFGKKGNGSSIVQAEKVPENDQSA